MSHHQQEEGWTKTAGYLAPVFLAGMLFIGKGAMEFYQNLNMVDQPADDQALVQIREELTKVATELQETRVSLEEVQRQPKPAPIVTSAPPAHSAPIPASEGGVRATLPIELPQAQASPPAPQPIQAAAARESTRERYVEPQPTMTSVDQTLDEATSLREAAKFQFDQLQASMGAAADEVRAIRSERDRLAQELESVSARLQLSEVDLARLRAEREAALSAQSTLRDSVLQLREQLAVARSEVRDEQDQIRAELDAARERETTQQRLLEQRAERIVTLSERLETSETAVTTLQGELSKTQEQLQRAQDNVTALETGLARMADALDQRTTEVVRMRAELDAARTERQQLRNALKQTRDTQRQISAALSRALGVNASLQEHLVGLSENITLDVDEQVNVNTRQLSGGQVDEAAGAERLAQQLEQLLGMDDGMGAQ